MDPIKEAFDKIKEEILLLKEEISLINNRISDNQTTPTHKKPINNLILDRQSDNQTTPTHNNNIQSPYIQNTQVSIGNKGVPTNTPTDTQTHQQSQKWEFKDINNILNSLDSAKKEIRLKFKRLTPQEMSVFSIIYRIEEQYNTEITYKTIAQTLRLSESSIRDYINKLIKKGIPINKTRQNNKTIILKISQDLKQIATLSTIQNLRKI